MLRIALLVEICLQVQDWVVLSAKFVKKYWTVPTIGITVLVLLWLCDISLAKTIFWGIFAAFTVVGYHVFETHNFSRIGRFCDINEKISKILFLVSLVGLIFQYAHWLNGEFWQLFSWPLMTASVVLFVLSILGQIAVSTAVCGKAFFELDPN